MKSADASAHADAYLDWFAMQGYGYPENYERLRRCEELAEKKRATVPQIALAYVFSQPFHTFAILSTSKATRMQENIDALGLHLTDSECRYLESGQDG